MTKVLTHRPFKSHIFVIQIHSTPHPSLPHPPPLLSSTNVVVFFWNSFTAIIQHWIVEGSIFVECSEFFEGKKMPFRINVATTFSVIVAVTF